MTPERWTQIEELFHRAAECPPANRAALLDAECHDDRELRREVEALLTSEENATDDMQAAVCGALNTVAFPLVGRTISHYRILGSVGGGGMGLVYRAEDTKLGRLVALKFLPEESAKDSVALGRFEREARSASALEHPNICPIYEFADYAGQPFLAMQLLEGQTLRALISAAVPGKPPLPPERLLDLAIQIADGLDAAHQRGIIHRDIKPANIFVTEQGQAKILDFGLAKLATVGTATGASADEARAEGQTGQLHCETVRLGSPDPFLSRTGLAMGTAGYMSPEQARGEQLDVRTDLFSFGLVLYEMATGQHAFKGDTGIVLRDAGLRHSPIPTSELNSTLPKKLEKIVNKALERDKEARYQSAAEVRADLMTLRQRLPGRRAVWRWAMAVGALLLLASILALWIVVRRSPAQPPQAELRQRPLTDNSTENAVSGGTLSPDGKYLAYSDAKGIKIKSVVTGEMRTVPQPNELRDKDIEWKLRSWFPDGTRFLANATARQLRPYEVGSRGTSVWIFSLDGAPHKLRDDAFAYSVSPDGSLISFGTKWGSAGDREIWVMGVNEEPTRKLYGTDEDSSIRDAVWSPDGKLIAYDQYDKTGSSLMIGDVYGGRASTLFPSTIPIIDFLWLADGRLLYSLYEPDTNSGTCNFWGLRLDARTRKPSEKARRLTSWSDFCMNFAGATADGHKLAFLKWRLHETTYVADLDATGSYISNPRHLLSDSAGIAGDWTTDSKALVSFSSQIEKQLLNGDASKLVTVPKEGVRDLRVSPDGKWILYLPQDEATGGSVSPTESAVMRVSIDGGSSQRVFTAQPDSQLRCARHPSNLCAIAEPTGSPKQVIITAFDPVRGRGSEMARLSLDSDSDDWTWDLSPDGTRIAALRNPLASISILNRGGRLARVVRVKGWSNLKSLNWTARGDGLFVASDNDRPGGAALLHVDLQGHASVLWKQLEAFTVAPAPDGRHLAFSGNTMDANIWMMENF